MNACGPGAAPDSTFIRNFESGDIDAGAFDHAAHVRLAWEYLERHDFEETARRYCAGLRSLTARLGVAEKYHETITRFLLRLIAERRAGAADWESFRAANPDLFGNVRALLLRHYSAERLDSPLARQRFLPPDRQAAGDQGTVIR